MSKDKKKGIIHINDIRRKKGLEPVENINFYSTDDFNNEESLYSFDDVDKAYDDYVIKSSAAKDDENRLVFFKEFVEIFVKRFNEISTRIINNVIEKSPLKEVINYAYEGSGKRLRPLLMYIAYRMCDGDCSDDILNFMIAIEILHSYSLIHDDLPCMDNDEIRRGKESVWKKYGEAKAVLAGDSMINLSQEIAGFSLLSSVEGHYGYINDLSSEIKEFSDITLDQDDIEDLFFDAKFNYVFTQSMQILSKAAGSLGMVAGQVLDLQYEDTKNVTKDEIAIMYGCKTGCLLSACLMIGYEISLFDDTDSLLYEFDNLGRILGIMYQIKDDIDDVTLSTEKLGKPSHSDEKNNKNTFVSIAGLENAKKDLSDLSDELDKMITNLSKKDIKVRSLKDFTYYIFNK